MEDIKRTISLRCTFCRSQQFILPNENYQPSHGGLVVCANCGRENDFTSLWLAVKGFAMEMTEEYAEKILEEAGRQLEKQLKNAFRGNKYVKIK